MKTIIVTALLLVLAGSADAGILRYSYRHIKPVPKKVVVKSGSVVKKVATTTYHVVY